MAEDRILPYRIMTLLMDWLVLSSLWMGLVWIRSSIAVGPWFDGEQPALGLDVLHIERALNLGVVVSCLWLCCLYAQGSYENLRRKTLFVRQRQICVAAGMAVVLMMALMYLVGTGFSRLLVISHGVLGFVLVSGARTAEAWLLGRLRRGSFDPKRVLVVGSQVELSGLMRMASRHPEWGFKPTYRLEPSIVFDEDASNTDEIGRLLDRLPFDEVHVAASLSTRQLGLVAQQTGKRQVPLAVDASFMGFAAEGVSLEDLGSICRIAFQPDARRWEFRAKRALDLTGAVVGLIVLAPVFALIALSIKLQDGGPVFFAQQRVGRHGKPFTILKFRTMVPGADRRWQELVGLAKKPSFDPRVTFVGRWLRRSSLDELPQLFNVLKGEMSLVGPRPWLPDELAASTVRGQRRLVALPGMTGLWQVSGRADVGPKDAWRYDLQYIQRWNIWLDLELLARTVPAVFRGTGAR